MLVYNHFNYSVMVSPSTTNRTVKEGMVLIDFTPNINPECKNGHPLGQGEEELQPTSFR